MLHEFAYGTSHHFVAPRNLVRYRVIADSGKPSRPGFVLEGAPDRNRAPQVRYTERWRVPIDIEVISPAAVAARRVPAV